MWVNIITIILSIVAIAIAIWQGFLSKQQLERADATKKETEKLLGEIKEKVAKVENIADETRKGVNDQINKLIDKQDENFKILLNKPKEDSQNELMIKLLPQMIGNPETLKTLVELGKNK